MSNVNLFGSWCSWIRAS